MNVVIVELQGEIIASENPAKVSVDDLNVKYPKGTIFFTLEGEKDWYVINRGSPVKGMYFNTRAKAFNFPTESLPEIVRLAAMIVN